MELNLTIYSFNKIDMYVSLICFFGIMSQMSCIQASDSAVLYVCCQLIQIIDKIGLQCKDFLGLSVQNTEITDEVASAIVSKLATIKYLVLDEAILDKEHLEMILLGCKDLELLYVFNSVGFNDDAYDKYILKLASLSQGLPLLIS